MFRSQGMRVGSRPAFGFSYSPYQRRASLTPSREDAERVSNSPTTGTKQEGADHTRDDNPLSG
jgi:hypothetical protein